jgi:hypothetical protein
MNICHVPISIGELWDKFTILCIKKEKITEKNHILTEIEYFLPILKKYLISKSLYLSLTECNSRLWDIENEIREKERKKEFDNEFIQLARKVYFTNDRRSAIKLKINQIFHSDIIEMKLYTKY